jgi:hypothetical protein
VISCLDCGGEPPLCDLCVNDKYAHMAGTAGARGYAWGQEVAGKVGCKVAVLPPWPSFAGKARAIALTKVVDLAPDERLRERLAQVCWANARRRYERLRPDHQ